MPYLAQGLSLHTRLIPFFRGYFVSSPSPRFTQSEDVQHLQHFWRYATGRSCGGRPIWRPSCADIRLPQTIF